MFAYWKTGLFRMCARTLFVSAAIFFLARPGPCPAAGDALHIDIHGPGQKSANLYVAPLFSEGEAVRGTGDKAVGYLKENLFFAPFLNQVNGTELVGGKELAGFQARDIDFKRLQLSRVDVLITAVAREEKNALAGVAFRAFDVFSGRMILGKGYTLIREEQASLAARKFSVDLVEKLAGSGGLYQARIAFSRKNPDGTKDICLTRIPGRDVRQITELPGISTSPAFSPDGSRVVFSNMSRDGHRLGIWERNTDGADLLDIPGTICISPVISPNGKIAASLNPRGNPDICYLSPDMDLSGFLVRNWAIDVSPAFDRSGEKMVFVSSRLGNPHVFVLDLKTNNIKRVTYTGKYNTSPSISPDGKLVVYSGRTESGHRIFINDLKSGMRRQLTFGPGNDEEPSFGPNGHFIVFSSNRGGSYKLYLTTVNGARPRMIPTGPGEATTPDWCWKEVESGAGD